MGVFDKRNSYDELMGTQYLKILKESVDIFNNTKNPDTFFQRYTLAEEYAENLCKLNGIKFIGQQPKQIVEQLSKKKQAAIHDMIDRFFDDTVNNADKVKNADAKLKKFAWFITVLEEYYPAMNDANIRYVNELYNNAIKYISIVEKSGPKQEITLHFLNGYITKIEPDSAENIYDCRYIISDGAKYDLLNIQSIRSISVPAFQIIDSFSKYGATGSLDYVIRMKAGKYFNEQKKKLCSACLWKSTELMLANKFYGWRKEDFERLVIWHYEMKMFSEGEAAQIFLKQHDIYENQFDSIATSIKDIVFKDLKLYKKDLVAFHGYESGSCAECAKMLGRVYSVTGEDNRFPKLPEYVKKHGNFHNGCRCTMSVYFEEIGTVWHHGKEVNAFDSSNRSWIDDRTEHELNSYQSYLDYIATNAQKENDRKEYQTILEKLPEIAPKSFSTYRRMKNAKTKNFETLLNSAIQLGIKIDI